jgi:hypothetical protein
VTTVLLASNSSLESGDAVSAVSVIVNGSPPFQSR